ncbi:MAG: TonB-dependent receptor [Caulobacteraceae bacterium]|nr:TonB-dependent receptor [Caulobacteraceae bacterium]
MRGKTALLSAGAMSVLAWAGGAAAQDAAVQRGNVIEELVVTAERRAQNLQDVPVAVSAFTSEKRDIIGIKSVEDITNYTPGLSYSVGTDRITLRGIGRLTNNLASEPGVANYNDGIYSSSTVSAGASPLFIDRVEVLRGPQGTLYGRNSIGGAINVISRRPTHDFYAEVRATLANYDRQVFEGAVSGSIVEGLRARFAASKVDQDEGWFKNAATGIDEGEVRDQFSWEGQIEADLGENVDAWLKVGQQQYNNRAAPGGRSGGSLASPEPSLFGPGSLSPGASYAFVGGVNLVTLGPIVGNPVAQTGDLRVFSTNVPNENDLESEYLTGEVVWHLPSVDVKYLGGYFKYDYVLTTDYDGTAVLSYTLPLAPGGRCAQLQVFGACGPLTFAPSVTTDYEEHKEWWSHEVNFTSTHDGPLQWIAGLFYYHEKYTQPVRIREPGVVALETPLSAPRNADRTIYYTSQDMDMTSRAAFVQLDWQFTDTLKTTLGLRYTKDEKQGTEETRQLCYGLPACLASVAPLYGIPVSQASIPYFGTLTPVLDITGSVASGNRPAGSTEEQKGVAGPAVTDPNTGVRSRPLADSWSAWTGTAGLEWKPDDDTLAYAKYSRGYKAGGFNSGTITPFPQTDKETVNAYELGLKRDWFGNLQTNVSAFYYDYQDAQVPLGFQPDTGPRITLFYNMPKSVSKGVEIETIWQPIDNLQILFNYSYLNAKIKKACCLLDSDDPLAIQPGAQPSGPPGAIDSATGLPTRAQDLSGQRLPLSPKHKIALNGAYTWDFAAGSLIGSASYLWRDEVYSSIFNRPLNLAPSRGQVDLRLTWRDADDRFSIIGYVQNATDEEDFDSLSATRNSIGELSQTYVLTPPRTYGVEFQYRF